MADFLVPDRDDPHGGAFWHHCAAHELRMQRCDGCGRLRFPPRPMCPWCRSTASTWDLMSGRATVWSVAIPHPPLLPAYTDLAPYNVIVVALDEDPIIRLAGNLVTGPDGALGEIEPHTIQIGEPVEVVFSRITDDIVLPRWKRAG